MLCTSISFFTLSLIHNGQCVAEKSQWDKPPMCTKKLCFSYLFTFALAKRQIKTLRCSSHFALYLYYYLCQSKRKFCIRSRTFEALIFHVSMTWSQPKSNQLQLISNWYPVLQPHFNVVTQEEMLLWIALRQIIAMWDQLCFEIKSSGESRILL